MDISYSNLAGCYGLIAHSKQSDPNAKPGARDILVLKRNGSYAVHFAKQRTPAAHGKLAVDLSGQYTIAADGSLLLTRTDSQTIVKGTIETHGAITLVWTDGKSITQRWLASKIICIWPKCHDCRGNRWQYCVRERVLNSL